MMEIESTSTFLANFLRSENRQVSRVDTFRRTLEELLKQHYQDHWYPEQPSRGSGYRCLRIDRKMDPLIAKAGGESGFDESALRKLLPQELTLWIDPQEVSYRIGEEDSICILYNGSNQRYYHSQDVYQHSPVPNVSVHHVLPQPPAQYAPQRYPGFTVNVQNIDLWAAFSCNPRSHVMVGYYAAFFISQTHVTQANMNLR